MSPSLKRSGMVAAIAAVAGVAASYFYKLEAQVEESGKPMVTVNVPSLEGEAKAGEALFIANCIICHGRNASGKQGAGPPLVHKIYEPSHHSDRAFYMAVQQGVRAHHWPFGDMAAVEGVTDVDVTKIIAYVRTLQRANGIN